MVQEELTVLCLHLKAASRILASRQLGEWSPGQCYLNKSAVGGEVLKYIFGP